MWMLRCGPCGKHANIRVQAFAPPPAVSSAGLVVSQPKKPRLESRISSAIAAIVAHAAAIVMAVILTIPSPELLSSSQDTAVVFISAPSSVQPRARPLPPLPDLTGLKIQGVKTSLPPLDVPTEIPASDPTQTFDPGDYSGVGVDDSVYTGLFRDSSGSEYDPNRIWPSGALPGEPPRLIAGPRLIYPPWMRESGIEGFVVLQFVIDTAGLTEQQTIEVIRATHEGFVEPALHIIRNSLYSPGRVRGRPVRVLSQIHINFALPDTSTTRPYPLR
jgi:TonB family protein